MEYGWILNKNLACTEKSDWEYVRREKYSLQKRLLGKFPKDLLDCEFFHVDFFLDGYVENRGELEDKFQEKWERIFFRICQDNVNLNVMRGAFSGFVYNRDKDEITLYTDQMGNKTLYYFIHEDFISVSSSVEEIVKVLKKNKKPIHLDQNAVKYMLTYGYMLDDTTFIKEIKRVLPGHKIILQNGKVRKEVYYRLNNEKIECCTFQEAIDKIDMAFRTAIRREFEKDREGGYRHLVDLSGGLDSRMVCWVADELGYCDQLNITYCKNGYLDQKISQQIAENLRHDFLFKPLDDVNWLYDIDEIVEKNNGAALFTGITGGNRLLKSLNKEQFGIEHTGMIGDVIISAFFAEESEAYSKPEFGKMRYSDKLQVQLDKNVLHEYPNMEIFTLATRAILGAASSYMIRQNYFETASPFMDVDFVNTCLSLPLSYRARHEIYLEWISQKYPKAAEYGWEKWGGAKPKKNEISRRKIITAGKLLKWKVESIAGRIPKDINMNPIDYWYRTNYDLQRFFEDYFQKNIGNPAIEDEMRGQIETLFKTGSVSEKGMALTVLGLVKLYFDVI
ncbi:MAG: hypothetical protein ACLTWK_10815 [Eisenbergiella sp.]